MHAVPVVYDTARIRARSRVIDYAIDARRQRFRPETPHVYKPFVESGDIYRWDDAARECLNKSVFSGIRVSWPVDETPEPIGDVLSCQEMGISMPEPTVPAALRRLRTDSPHVRRWRRAQR